jgi:hypothetical protein
MQSTSIMRERIASIDALRGLVIILMALDHVRTYFGPLPFGPLDLTQTTPAWFSTRYVTHLCAPIFVFSGRCRRGTVWPGSGAPGAGEISRDARDMADLSGVHIRQSELGHSVRWSGLSAGDLGPWVRP